VEAVEVEVGERTTATTAAATAAAAMLVVAGMRVVGVVVVVEYFFLLLLLLLLASLVSLSKFASDFKIHKCARWKKSVSVWTIHEKVDGWFVIHTYR
jgi:hypothetical protein